MGAGMGERENDTRGYGSHLPKQSPNPTPTFTCPTPLRTFTLGSHTGIWHGARAATGRKLKGPLKVLHH